MKSPDTNVIDGLLVEATERYESASLVFEQAKRALNLIVNMKNCDRLGKHKFRLVDYNIVQCVHCHFYRPLRSLNDQDKSGIPKRTMRPAPIG